jgi:hypothetical protein
MRISTEYVYVWLALGFRGLGFRLSHCFLHASTLPVEHIHITKAYLNTT